MNNFLIFDSEKIKSKAYRVVDPHRLDHVKKVLKLKVDDSIKVCLVNSGIGLARITALSTIELKLELLSLVPGTASWCHLIVGVSRPQTCKKILEHGTSMGANHFSFITAKLSEKSYLNAQLFKQAAWKKYLLNGLSQSGIYSQLPSVETYTNFNFPIPPGPKYILSPFASEYFPAAIDATKIINLAIGPERGWTEAEILYFKSIGFTEVKISPAILRVETATFVSMGQLELLAHQGNSI